MKKSVLVAGAGASGLMAALWAARAGASVTLLEGEERPGKKLLITGNGRCNLTNREAGNPEFYHGAPPKWLQPALDGFTPEEVLAFFAELGVLTAERRGYYYPATGQSSCVLGALLAELQRLSVKIKYKEKIREIKINGGIYTAITDTWQYEAQSLILCCGSKAAPSTGSDGSGYSLAEALGHKIKKIHPALCPVTVKEGFLPSVSGVRSRASVSLWRQMPLGKPKLLGQEEGEVQWTAYGISGIAVFQLSRFISQPGISLKDYYFQLDLIPEQGDADLTPVLASRACQLGDQKAALFFSGVLHEKLVIPVMERAGLSKKLSCRQLSKEAVEEFVREAKHFVLHPAGTKSFEQSQVCAGGVDTSLVKKGTLESRLHPGLFFAGEILDVDGPCGGFNLQWAWASGKAAGCAAAENTETDTGSAVAGKSEKSMGSRPKRRKKHEDQNSGLKNEAGSYAG